MRLQTRTSETVSIFDITLKRHMISDVSNVQQPSAYDLSTHGFVQQWERVYFQSPLTIVENLESLHFDPNRFIRALHNSLQPNAICPLVRLFKYSITNKERPVQPSSVELTVVKSGYVQTGFVPVCSDCKTASWGHSHNNQSRKGWRRAFSCAERLPDMLGQTWSV